MLPWNSTPGGFAYNWQSKWVGIIAIKTERTQIHFLSDVLVAVASLDLKVPILAGKRDSRRRSTTGFSENVVVTETSYQNNVRRFIILISGEGFTSFNKNKRVNLFCWKKVKRSFPGVNIFLENAKNS